MLDTLEDINKEAVQFFTNMYTRTNNLQANSDNCVKRTAKTISTASGNLNRPFSYSKIREATFFSHSEKTTGPRFSSYLKFVVKLVTDVSTMIKAFYDLGFLLSEVNETFVSLIPKGKKKKKIGTFRPISSCSMAYKLILNILIR